MLPTWWARAQGEGRLTTRTRRATLPAPRNRTLLLPSKRHCRHLYNVSDHHARPLFRTPVCRFLHTNRTVLSGSREQCTPALKASAVMGLPNVLSVAAGGYQTLAAIKPEYPWQMLL